jgi:superfamily I DNA and/or RNA helicase
MHFNQELEGKLKRLEDVLEEEIERTNKKAKREHSIAKVESAAPGVAIVETEMEINSGELVGIYNLSDKPKPIGFVVKKFERMGKNYYVINTKSIDYGEIPYIFQICKVDFLYSLEKRLEAVKSEIQDFEILQRFQIVEAKHLDGILPSKPENKLPLDEFQTAALESTLNLEKGEILLIVGPPGTGKTQFITEAGRMLGENEKVLVTSHIHQAVDNVFERLTDFEERFGEYVDYAVRVGHISKVSEKARKFSPENRYLDSIPENLSFDDLVEEYSSAFRRISNEYVEIFSKSSFLAGSTALKTITYPLSNQRFSYAFIDESHNLCLSIALLVLSRSERAILTGDPWQIPPVYTSISIKERSKFGIFNVLYEMAEREMKEILWLRYNYRSNPKIVEFSSDFIYGGKIIPKPKRSYKLEIKNAAYRWMSPEESMVFIHRDGVKDNKSNEDEAKAIAWIVKELIKAGASPDDIAVLTPYRNQVEKIKIELIERGLRKNEVEVRTVHSYLGAEKDVVLFSVVDTSNFEFIDHRMINVAVTRAKKKFIAVGNYSSILKYDDKPISQLLKFIMENGLVVVE